MSIELLIKSRLYIVQDQSICKNMRYIICIWSECISKEYKYHIVDWRSSILKYFDVYYSAFALFKVVSRYFE